MKPRDHTRLLAELEEDYKKHSPKCGELSERARRYMVDGVSHTLRFLKPFPPRIVSASGAYVTDADGHRVMDFWQGHFANILGHNPALVTEALAGSLRDGFGLQTGYPDVLQIETAEVFCRQTGSERVRFTTSGSLSTMYAMLLSRAFTGRDLVMKVGGGWHGGQPWALKGVGYQAAAGVGYDHVESAGLPPAVTKEVVLTKFNDPEALQADFRKHGDKLACFIVEPFIGSGGMTVARTDYLRAARQLTEKHGALLIFDEVIAGFRFRAGNAGRLFGIQPDLATFGKVMGGGMPVAVVGGRADVMELTGGAVRDKVSFSGGTYSAHPSSLLAARTMMNYLVEHEAEIYPKLADIGEKVRRTLEDGFAREGIYAYCSGRGNDSVPGSSVLFVHFPYQEGSHPDQPEQMFNPAVCDVVLSDKILHLAFLLEDIHFLHGHGAASIAHGEGEIQRLAEVCRSVARRVKKHL